MLTLLIIILGFNLIATLWNIYKIYCIHDDINDILNSLHEISYNVCDDLECLKEPLIEAKYNISVNDKNNSSKKV